MRIFPFLLIFASTSICAQPLQAEINCRLTRTDYVYDCTIKLARNGRPLSGADVTVDADIPSMPKVHSVMPARAQPGSAPGAYETQLDLEMLRNGQCGCACPARCKSN